MLEAVNGNNAAAAATVATASRIRKLNNRQHQLQQQHPQQQQQQPQQQPPHADLIRSCRELENSGGSFSLFEFIRIVCALIFSVVSLFLKKFFDPPLPDLSSTTESSELSRKNNNNNNDDYTSVDEFVGSSTIGSALSHYYKTVENRVISHDGFYSLYYKLYNFTMLDRLRRFWRWRPTSIEDLDRAENRILEHIRCKPKTYFVNIGKGWDLENVRIWTLEVPPKIVEKEPKMPIVMIHGFAAGVGLWCLNLDQIAQRDNRRILAFDVLGFAKSSRPNLALPKFRGLTALQQSKAEAEKMEEFMVDSIERWRVSMGINEKFIILGHSFGAYLSLAYALRHPKYVGHVILADPWGMPADSRTLNNSGQYTSSRQLPLWAKFGAKVFLDLLTPLAVLRAAGPWGPKIIGSLRNDLRNKFRRLTEPGADSVEHVDMDNLQAETEDDDDGPVNGEVEIKTEEGSIVLDYIYHCNAQSKPSGEIAFKKMCTGTGWARLPMLERVSELESHINLSFIFGSRSWVDRQSGFQAKYLLAHNASNAAFAAGARRNESSDDDDEENERVNVHILQGAGHHVYADKPDEFNQLVLDICADVDLAARGDRDNDDDNNDNSHSNNVLPRTHPLQRSHSANVDHTDAVLNSSSTHNSTSSQSQQSQQQQQQQSSSTGSTSQIPAPSHSRSGSFRHSDVILEEESL